MSPHNRSSAVSPAKRKGNGYITPFKNQRISQPLRRLAAAHISMSVPHAVAKCPNLRAPLGRAWSAYGHSR